MLTGIHHCTLKPLPGLAVVWQPEDPKARGHLLGLLSGLGISYTVEDWGFIDSIRLHTSHTTALPGEVVVVSAEEGSADAEAWGPPEEFSKWFDLGETIEDPAQDSLFEFDLAAALTDALNRRG